MPKYLKIAPDPDAKPCRCGDGNPDCDHFDFCPECGGEYKAHEGHDCIDGVPVQDLRALAKELRDAMDACETERDRLRAELDLVHGAIRADDERLYAAWVRIHGAPDDCANIGCDAPEWMADEILRLRAELERTKEELERARSAGLRLLAGVEDYHAYEHDGDPWREDARTRQEMEIDELRGSPIAEIRSALATQQGA